MRRSPLLLALLAFALTAVLVPIVAQAKSKKSKKSSISKVSPMRAKPGTKLTIRGKNFSRKRRSNTVIFKGASGRTIFVKPKKASSRKLVVVVPSSIEDLIKGDSTRMRLRVVVKHVYGKQSSTRHSPLVLTALDKTPKPAPKKPAPKPAPNNTQTGTGSPAKPPAPKCGDGLGGTDPDHDLLSTTLERQIKTNPCTKDTDGDGVEDGFEYYSAKDLNQNAVPYPGKKPYPNALDGTDANHDYDGDGLTNIEEYKMWAHPSANPPASTLQTYTTDPAAPAFGGPYDTAPSFGNHQLPLNYSDGDQSTVVVNSGDPGYHSWLDFDGDGTLTDDERDVDGDGLSNIQEAHGGVPNDFAVMMRIAHYPDAGEADAFPNDDCDYVYKPAIERPYLEPDYLDWDTDGDGVWDGNDDQDHDGVSNVDEIKGPYTFDCDSDPLPIGGARNGATAAWDGGAMRRNPYEPCLPYRSEYCRRYVLQGG